MAQIKRVQLSVLRSLEMLILAIKRSKGEKKKKQGASSPMHEDRVQEGSHM